MTKKSRSITNKLYPLAVLAGFATVWQIVCCTGLVPAFMLPSPTQVVRAFIGDFPLLMEHSVTSLTEAFIGLGLGIAGGFVLAMLMDASDLLYKCFYPLLVLTQTVPSVALAPLLVLWMGYGMAPKITLVFLVCFFPIAVGLLNGFRSADPDAIRLLRSMGASSRQVFRHIKLPSSMGEFFSGLKIAVCYSVVGAVIAEWLGGNSGLGVYMTRVRKSYSFDKMFAVILLISGLSLLLMWLVTCIEKWAMPWVHGNKRSGG